MKHLITSGCSFSECISNLNTWPKHLSSYLGNYTHVSGAVSGQGNGLISRSIIYHVSEKIKTTAPEDILVGIMWSGPERHDFYHSNIEKELAQTDKWSENPTGFTGSKKWAILNYNWHNNFSKLYYTTFHDHVGSVIYTLEHILRVQWFLEKYKIRYFMGKYMSYVMPEKIEEHTDVQHLYNQIDFDKFLPVSGMFEWCRDESKLPFPINGDPHPSSNQHKLFTEQIIVPFLKEKNYI